MYKKIGILLILIALLTGVFTVVYADSDYSDIQSEATLLTYLNIVTPYDDGDYHMEELVTRAKLCKMMYVILMRGNDYADGTGAVFADVPKDYWAAGYIEALHSMGYVNGYDNGMFFPDAPVTFEQASKMIISVLGYSVQAERAGGWSKGYMKIASELGLHDGVTVEPMQSVTREQIIRLIANALKIKPMVTSAESNRDLMTADKTILDEYFHIEKVSGRVQANDQTGIGGSSKLGDGKIQIEGAVYDCADPGYRSFLGKYVEGYADKTEEGKLICLRESSISKSVRISAEELKSENGGGTGDFQNPRKDPFIKYRDKEKKRIKTLKIEKTATIIKNGQKLGYASEIKNEDIIPEVGEIEVISDKNGKNDVVNIHSYEYYVVGFINITDGRITDKFGKPELATGGDVTYDIQYNGRTIGLDALNEWDVLAVAADKDRKNLHIIKIGQTVNGNIEAISDDMIKIEGKEYKKGNILAFGDVVIGSSGTFYLGIDNEVVAAQLASIEGERYAVCLKMIYDGEENVLSFKMFSSDNKAAVYKCSDKIQIDSTRVTDLETFYGSNVFRDDDGNFERQIVKFSTNKNNEIVKLYTQKGGSVKKEATGLYIYCKKGAIGSNYRADENTIAFFIPNDKNAPDSEYEAYRLTSIAENWHTVDVYDLAEDYTSQCVVIIDESERFSVEYASRPIAIIKSINSAVNEENESVKAVTVMMNGKESDFLTEEDLDFTKMTEDGKKELATGDVILFEVDTKGDIRKFYVLLDNEYAGKNYTETWFNSDAGIVKSEAANSVLYTVNGIIKDQINDIILVDINGVVKPYSLKNCMFYKYDRNEKIKLSMGFVGDLYKGAHVFMRVYKSELQELVVYDE